MRNRFVPFTAGLFHHVQFSAELSDWATNEAATLVIGGDHHVENNLNPRKNLVDTSHGWNPDNTDGTALKGALQAALDYDGSAGAGPEVAINQNFRSSCRTLDSEVTLRFLSFPKSASPQPVEFLISQGETLEVRIPTNALSEAYQVQRLSTWAVVIHHELLSRSRP